MTNIEKIDKEKKRIMSHIHIPSVKCECCPNTIDALLLIDDTLSSLIQIRQETLDEVAQKLIEIEKEKWKDAKHCTCLSYAIVSIFGEKYEEILQACKKENI